MWKVLGLTSNGDKILPIKKMLFDQQILCMLDKFFLPFLGFYWMHTPFVFGSCPKPHLLILSLSFFFSFFQKDLNSSMSVPMVKVFERNRWWYYWFSFPWLKSFKEISTFHYSFIFQFFPLNCRFEVFFILIFIF